MPSRTQYQQPGDYEQKMGLMNAQRVNLGAELDLGYKKLGLDEKRLAQEESQYGRSLGFKETELAQEQGQFESSLGFRESELAQAWQEFEGTMAFKASELDVMSDYYQGQLDLGAAELGTRQNIAQIQASAQVQAAGEGARTAHDLNDPLENFAWEVGGGMAKGWIEDIADWGIGQIFGDSDAARSAGDPWRGVSPLEGFF